jgi:hypothetical protein
MRNGANVRTSEDLSSLREENSDLRRRLAEAEETLDAIRSGEVDALVIGDQIYSLESSVTASNSFAVTSWIRSTIS